MLRQKYNAQLTGDTPMLRVWLSGQSRLRGCIPASLGLNCGLIRVSSAVGC
jgi:hypothetical protein